MTDSPPVACSLGADALGRRLAQIAALGSESLLSRSSKGETRVLRFRSDPQTRRRLEEIVAAEARCCPFLDLDITDEGDELALRITAPRDAAPLADELSLAFGEPRWPS
jgi:hypothetical protein